MAQAKKPAELDALYDDIDYGSGGYSGGSGSDILIFLLLYALGGWLSSKFLLSKGFSNEAAWGLGISIGAPLFTFLCSDLYIE